MLTNADVGELLWRASREEADHRRRALERASRAARFWPDEVHDLAAGGRSLTELRAVGPWVATQIENWLADPPPVPEADETRRGFLTYAEVRSTLDADPAWESLPCGDLQIHTTYSDGAVSLENMIGAARVLGRSFVAVTDHSRSLQIANGMTSDRLALQRRAIDTLDAALADAGDDIRILRSMEVDVFPDG